MDDSASLLDETNSLDNWYLLLGFVSTLIERFSPSKTYTRIALAKFSTDAVVLHRFSDFQDIRYINDRLMKANFRAGETQLILGLNLTRDQIFRPQFGDRPTVPNILIVITDGKPTITTIEQLKGAISSFASLANPAIIPVGVTSDVDYEVLGVLVEGLSRKLKSTVSPITVPNFALLSQYVERVYKLACYAIKSETI